MHSKTRSTKLPPDLAEVAELRAKALGYPSWNAYIKGLIRYDALCQGPLFSMRSSECLGEF